MAADSQVINNMKTQLMAPEHNNGITELGVFLLKGSHIQGRKLLPTKLVMGVYQNQQL